MNLIAYWGYIFIVFFISFVPGFAIATCFRSLSLIEQLAISTGFSFALVTLILPFFSFELNSFAQLIYLLILFISVRHLLKNRAGFTFGKDARVILLVFIIGIISKFFIQTLWEYPVMGGDWFGHTFQTPYHFENGDWTPPRDRTSFFSVLIYSYHNLLGSSLYEYWISQIISIIINSVYIFPAYLISKKLFVDWVARISALFMLVTPFLIFNTLYTWPKNAAMYGILVMIYFLFFSDHKITLRFPIAGFFGGMGFLFHNYAGFYIGIAILLLICREKINRGNVLDILKKSSYFFIFLLIVIAPYFMWVYSYYGTLSTSRFVYYPIAVKGYDSALNENNQELFDTFYRTPVREIIMIRIINTIVTLTPAALPINPIAANFPTYNPIYYYTHDYPGALSTLMYLIVVIWFFRYLTGRTGTDYVIVSYLILPLIINLVLYGWKEWGLVGQILHPTVPLLIILGVNELNNLKKFKSEVLYLLFFGAAIELLIFSRIINNFYYIEGGITNVVETGTAVTPLFDISHFVSAFFFLNDPWNFYGNVMLSIILVFVCINLLKKTD